MKSSYYELWLQKINIQPGSPPRSSMLSLPLTYYLDQDGLFSFTAQRIQAKGVYHRGGGGGGGGLQFLTPGSVTGCPHGRGS